MGSLLLDVMIKGTLALLATGAVVAALRGASAATRHAVWTMGMAGALALPGLSRFLPAWDVALLPARPAGTTGITAPTPTGIDAGTLLAIAWGAGAAVVLASIVLGRVRIWWLARRSAGLDHGELPALVTALCGEIGISRRVEVRLSPDRVMPMVWGIARPVVLLPAEAATWSPDLRRDVLLHELAHVRRHDYLNQLISRTACAVHWFNPLAWMAARRLRAEREQACDDQVLRTGASACDYAEHLLVVARRMRPAGRGTLGVAMACRSAFGERVAALLDAGRARGVLTVGLLMRSGVGAACLVVPLAALHPGVRSTASDEPPGQVVGPPPSANARAGGALPEAPPPPVAPAVERAKVQQLARPDDRSSPARVMRSAASESVMIYAAPEIRAVIRTAGATFAEPESSDDHDGANCPETTSPAEGPVSPAAAPRLVWVPTGATTP
ncbi:MAG TPA: M56 family metallopeptidase [Gemmatimonadota bacterium]|jgi:beta-lactamase regulating signal transducer with metallopeptidase domain